MSKLHMSNLPDYSQMRFLVVDDEPFMVNTINRMLRMCGATDITIAHDGAAAFRMLNDEPNFDCIISDCNMRPINGLQLLQGVRMGFIKHTPRNQPFVMLTGHNDTGVVQTALQLDVSGYVVKPVAMETLIRAVTRSLEHGQTVKDAAFYRAAKLPQVQGMWEVANEVPGALTLLPADSSFRPSTVLKDVIEALRDRALAAGEESELKFHNRKLRRIFELEDGDVLAQDIEAETGTVLLRRGSALNPAIIHRLRIVAAEAHVKDAVWVGERAA